MLLTITCCRKPKVTCLAYAPLGLSGLSGTFFDFPPWKSCWDGVMFQNNFSLRVKMCGVFRKHDDYISSLHSAEKVVGPDVYCFVSLTFAAHNRLYLGPAGNTCNLNPSLIVLLHPAAIHLVGIAGKCNN